MADRIHRLIGIRLTEEQDKEAQVAAGIGNSVGAYIVGLVYEGIQLEYERKRKEIGAIVDEQIPYKVQADEAKDPGTLHSRTMRAILDIRREIEEEEDHG